mmetsp:Transcript_37919/g.100312  ORF Transcript_37919/g.100312 Transcript_37919/m.100312 type:complete len:111 (-) Transcript_37919:14-346(-)
MSSQAAGAALLAGGAVAFVYFTAWVLLLPMWAPEDAPWLHEAFPPRRWALAVPGLAFLTLVAGLTAFVGLALADVLPESAAARPDPPKGETAASGGGASGAVGGAHKKRA